MDVYAQRYGSGATARQARHFCHYLALLASRRLLAAAKPLSPGAGVRQLELFHTLPLGLLAGIASLFFPFLDFRSFLILFVLCSSPSRDLAICFICSMRR